MDESFMCDWKHIGGSTPIAHSQNLAPCHIIKAISFGPQSVTQPKDPQPQLQLGSVRKVIEKYMIELTPTPSQVPGIRDHVDRVVILACIARPHLQYYLLASPRDQGILCSVL